MVPQRSEEALTFPRAASGNTAPISGLALGRPPDALFPINVSASLERVEHPDIGDEEQVMKKSKGEGDVLMDASDVGFNGFSKGMAGAAGGGDSNLVSKPSFRDMLNASGSSTEECGVTDELRESNKLEKFGPWMQVMGRRARKGVSNRVLHNSEAQHWGAVSKPQDSGKFSVLANLERENVEDQELPVSDPDLGRIR
ncbi:hypothetical protein V6N13_036064 [Hibiscus sabdariffa]